MGPLEENISQQIGSLLIAPLVCYLQQPILNSMKILATKIESNKQVEHHFLSRTTTEQIANLREKMTQESHLTGLNKETITFGDISRLQEIFYENVHHEELYKVRNDAKLRAVLSTKTYDEFKYVDPLY